jgi:MFS family permease
LSRSPAQRFLPLFGLAWAGAAIAYVPFLTVILPLKLTALTGARDVQWLAIATLAGAVAASIANIGFGWASDASRNRRHWVAAGLLLTVLLLLAIARITDPLQLIAALVAWQCALNMMLAPLAAWAGDCVPDDRKGMLGGLMAFAPAAGAFAGALITVPGLADPATRLAIVAALVAAAVLPLLLFGMQLLPPAPADDDVDAARPPIRITRTVATMWVARLAVQIAEAALFAYLLFYFRSVDPDLRDADIARLLLLVLAGAAPLALIAGRWADRAARPLAPLVGCAALAAVGLAGMALATAPAAAVLGYVLFGVGATVFLGLHTSQTLRVLPRPDRRGRDLGLFNLTNTVPSLIMPPLALAIVPVFGYQPLLWLLAAFALGASLLLAGLPRQP